MHSDRHRHRYPSLEASGPYPRCLHQISQLIRHPRLDLPASCDDIAQPIALVSFTPGELVYLTPDHSNTLAWRLVLIFFCVPLVGINTPCLETCAVIRRCRSPCLYKTTTPCSSLPFDLLRSFTYHCQREDQFGKMADYTDQQRVPGTELLIDGTASHPILTVVIFCGFHFADQVTVSKSLDVTHEKSGRSDIVLIPQPTECGRDPVVITPRYAVSSASFAPLLTCLVRIGPSGRSTISYSWLLCTPVPFRLARIPLEVQCHAPGRLLVQSNTRS